MSTAVFGAPEWRAWSGRVIKPLEDGTITFAGSHGYLAPRTAMDAEEYFQAKRDEELGRWRWPENPGYVVYAPVGYSHYVRVLDERSAILEVIHREHLEGRGSLMAQAARAYFAAHPDRKPWEEAQVGDFWVVHHMGMRETCRVDDSSGVIRFVGVDGHETHVSMPVTHPSITDAVQLVVSDASSQAGLASIRGGL